MRSERLPAFSLWRPAAHLPMRPRSRAKALPPDRCLRNSFGISTGPKSWGSTPRSLVLLPIRWLIQNPSIHNRAFQSKRIDAVYLPFRVATSDLGDWMKVAEGLPVAGFSVTIPHKQKIIRHLDAVDSFARRIGAVNTVCARAEMARHEHRCRRYSPSARTTRPSYEVKRVACWLWRSGPRCRLCSERCGRSRNHHRPPTRSGAGPCQSRRSRCGVACRIAAEQIRHSH